MIINNFADFMNPSYEGNLILTLTADNSRFDALIVKERAPQTVLDAIKNNSTLLEDLKHLQEKIENSYSFNYICLEADSIFGYTWEWLDCLANRQMDDYDMDKLKAFIHGGNYTEAPMDQVVDNIYAIDACINEVCDECQQLLYRDISIDTLAAHIKSACYDLKKSDLYITFICTKEDFMKTLQRNDIDVQEVINRCTLSKVFYE